jgi:hypothetical protein
MFNATSASISRLFLVVGTCNIGQVSVDVYFVVVLRRMGWGRNTGERSEEDKGTKRIKGILGEDTKDIDPVEL